MYSEDLFFDDVPYTQVGTLSDLTAGNKKWFFDYDANVIYVADNPAGHTVETSVARSAFSGAADHVTIKNFVVEKYAAPMQMGAIGDQTPGPFWVVQNNGTLLNHGLGLKIGANSQAIANHVHHNGEMGMGGSGLNLLIQRNEIDHNNYYSGVNCAWECGGTKFSSSQYLKVRLNYSHDNFGDGLWTDINNLYATYEGNWVISNHASGIHHEVSYDALIKNNLIENNGSSTVSWLWSSQIEIVNSQNVEARNNTVSVASWSSGYEGNAIGILYQNRGSDSETEGSHNHVSGNLIHDNQITLQSGTEGAAGIVSDLKTAGIAGIIASQSGALLPTNPLVSDPRQNKFYSNHYHVAPVDLSRTFFKLPSKSLTLAEDQALGQEVGSTLDSN